MTDQEATPHGLPLGPPFALSVDCALLSHNRERQIDGCFACVACECGQAFRLNLLSSASAHRCPRCKTAFTSMLVVARTEDGTAFVDILETVLSSNGIELDDEQAAQLVASFDEARASNPDDDAGDDDDDDDQDAGDDDHAPDDDDEQPEPLR